MLFMNNHVIITDNEISILSDLLNSACFPTFNISTLFLNQLIKLDP